MHRWMEGGPHDDTVVVANFADRTIDDLSIGFPAPGPLERALQLRRVRRTPTMFGSHETFDLDADGPPMDGCDQSGARLARAVQPGDLLARETEREGL